MVSVGSVLVTPIVGVVCGLVAQARYKARLKLLPKAVAAGMPKRFPMADLLLGLAAAALWRRRPARHADGPATPSAGLPALR